MSLFAVDQYRLVHRRRRRCYCCRRRHVYGCRRLNVIVIYHHYRRHYYPNYRRHRDLSRRWSKVNAIYFAWSVFNAGEV